jgi:hypothetical protein
VSGAPAQPEHTAETRDGLCPSCRHVRTVTSERGSVFLLCQLAREEPSLPRYPPQPRMVCSGYAR